MAGPYYVRSTTGNDSSAGTSWALAKATLAGALAVAAAGDTIYVSQVHAETTTANITLTSPGTITNPVFILCVNDSTSPPTTLATTATVSTTSTGAIIFDTGYAYVYGISFRMQVGGSATGQALGFRGASLFGWTLDSCLLELATSGANGYIGSYSIVAGSYVKLINTPLKFNALTQYFLVKSTVEWKNTPSAIQGTVPTNLITLGAASASTGARLTVSGVDLSAVGSGKSMFNMLYTPIACQVFLRNCKLGSSFTMFSSAIATLGSLEVAMENCDSAATNYRNEYYRYQGSIVTETTITRNDGASDNITKFSWKMVSLATGPSFVYPLESPVLDKWGDIGGNNKTITVEFLHDSTTALTNADIWLEVEYLNDSGSPLSTVVTNKQALLTAATAQPSSNALWNTTGLTNPNTQKLTVTFTPSLRGNYRVRVMLAKPSYTVYVCPKMGVV